MTSRLSPKKPQKRSLHYLNNPTVCTTVDSYKSCFVDNLLISKNGNCSKNVKLISQRRDWRRYSKENLINMLNDVEWSIDID